MGHRAPDSPAIAKPSRRRSLLNLCLAPHVKDEDGVKHTKRRPASAPGSPRTTKQSPKSVHFSEFPTIHTYCVEYEDEGSNSSVASAVNSNVAAQDHNASRGAGSRQYQLLSRTSNTCPHLQVQDDNNSVSSWARRVAAAKDIHAAAHVHCSSDNSPAADAAVASPPDTPAEHLQLSDEQLAVLSRLDVSQQAALQCDAEQLFTSSTGQQQLGRGAHSEVSQAVLPWPSAEAAATAIAAAAEETGLNSTALLTAAAAGLPVVVKAVAHERFQGDGLFNIEGRKREEKFSRMVASSPYFPRLYRAVHMKRRSYFLFSSMTAQPATLVQYVQFRQQVLDTAIPAAASSQPGEQQLHQPVSGANSSSPQAPISTHAASCTATWQDSVLQILDDIAQGLDHLHTLGLLHLDLKPGNVIIRQGGRAYLIDLGVACEVGTSLEQHGRCGTEAFMDPEIRFDKELQGSYQIHHDYYSLGAVALYLVTRGNYKLFMQVQTELDQALLCRQHSAGRRRTRVAQSAVEAAGHIAAARRLLGSQAEASQVMVDLVLGLMVAPDERPRDYDQFKVLLQHARTCDQPEQQHNARDGGQISAVGHIKNGVSLLLVAIAVMVMLLALLIL